MQPIKNYLAKYLQFKEEINRKSLKFANKLSSVCF